MFVAFEIGNAMTKIVYGKKTKNKVSIKKYSLVKNGEGTVFPDGSLNLSILTPILKKELKSMKVGRADTYITLSSKASIVRLREFPLVPIKQMQELLRYDAEQFLPYEADAFTMDFRINQIRKSSSKEENADGDEMDKVAEVMVVIHPKELIEEHLKLADDLKLKTNKVTTYTEGLYSYCYDKILDNNKNIIVADVGGKNMRVTMFQGKKYFASNIADIGVEGIAFALASIHEVNDAAAHKLLFNSSEEKKVVKKPEVETSSSTNSLSRLETLSNRLKKRGDVAKSADVAIDADVPLENLYDQIAREVGRMIEFFKTRRFGYSVDEIYLIGGGANMNGLDAFLSKYHGLDVKKIASPDRTIISDADYNLLIPSIGAVLNQEVSL